MDWLARRRRVRALVGDRATFERGSPSSVTNDKVAVVAHWSISPRLSKSVCMLVHELQSFGYQVVLTSSCESPEQLVFDDAVDNAAVVVIRKPNVGYDFGSWSVALHLLPDIASAGFVLLANDSMVGPFTSLRAHLDRMADDSADVWGLTDTQQFGRHLQSYFLCFRHGTLASRPLRNFWADVRHEANKDDIIHRYEIGLGRLLHDEGFVQLPVFPHELVVEPGQNPVIIGWKQLLEKGFPFLKREILRDPSVAPEGDTAPMVLTRLLGVHHDEWLEGAPA